MAQAREQGGGDTAPRRQQPPGLRYGQRGLHWDKEPQVHVLDLSATGCDPGLVLSLLRAPVSSV